MNLTNDLQIIQIYLLSSISYLHPQNEIFLNYEQLKPMAFITI